MKQDELKASLGIEKQMFSLERKSKCSVVVRPLNLALPFRRFVPENWFMTDIQMQMYNKLNLHLLITVIVNIVASS